MLRTLIAPTLAGGALLAGGLAGCATQSGTGMGAMADADCSRAELRAAVDSYIAAQTAGDAALLDAAGTLAYGEAMAPADITTGILTQPLVIDFENTLLDTEACETFSELSVTDPSHPYVLGVHMGVEDGAITMIDTLVTDDDDWIFSAQRFYAGSRVENWNPIPDDRQDSRETLIAAADAYLDYFNDKSVEVPWSEPCYRQEGGMRTQGTCSAGVPPGADFPVRRYVVDRTLGSVVALVRFGGEDGLPDSHLFRLRDGVITNIHTITVCDEFNCGFDLPEELAEERRARGGLLDMLE